MAEFNRNILFQYFSGSASPLQVKLIEEWLSQENNTEMFFKTLEAWEKENIQFMPDAEHAAALMKEKLLALPLTQPQNPAYAEKKRTSLIRSAKLWWAAASLIALTLALYIFRNELQYKKYQTAYGQVQEFALPDGSRVMLNANSSLMVPRFGFGEAREVLLNGEAAFTVVHDKESSKFLVRTGSHLNVEVLGTEFSVYNRNHLNRVELKKGSVKIVFNGPTINAPMIMKPGDMASLDKEGKLFVKHRQSPANYVTWKDHRFVFDNTPLPEVLQTITDFFGDNIQLDNPALNDRNITGSFKAESSKELLNVLAEINDLEVFEQAGKLILGNKSE